jgi:Predicted nucleic-acid-binding protein containing a Zn-ribbon domain
MSHPNDPPDNNGQGCPKCGHEETEVDQISTTGSGLSKYFDVQNRSFTVISLYKGQSSGNAVDIFLG